MKFKLTVFLALVTSLAAHAQYQSAVVTDVQGDKVYIRVAPLLLRGDLDTLYATAEDLQNQIDNLSWADVLENGTTPGVDVDFFGFDAIGIGQVTTTGTFTGDSLVLNKDAAIAGRLNVTDVVSLSDSLLVEGTVVLNDSLRVVKAVSMGSRLHVTGVTAFGDSVHVVGNVDFDALFNVDGAATFGSTLAVTGETTLSDTLHAAAPALFADSVDVGGDLRVAQSASVVGNAAIGGTLGVTGAATLSSTLAVTGVTSLSDSLHVSGSADIDGNLNVDGATTLDGTTVDGALDVNGNGDVSGTLGVGGAATMGSTLAVTGETTLSDTLHAAAPALFADSVDVGGDLRVAQSASVVGNAAIGGTLGVTGAATLSSTLAVTGVTSLSDSLHVSGSADIDGNLNVDGATTLDGTTVDGALDVNGNGDVSGTLGVGGAATLGSTLGVTGETTLSDTLHAAAPALFADSVDVGGNAAFAGTVQVSGASTLSAVQVNGALDVNGQADVSGATALGSTLAVTGVATFADTLKAAAPGLFADSLDVAGNAHVADVLYADSIVSGKVVNAQVRDLANHNTDGLVETSTNRYFTPAREQLLQAQIDSLDTFLWNLLNQLFDPPSVITSAATPVAAYTASIHATFDAGGAEVEDSGFELSLNSDLSDSTVYAATGAESLAEALSSLTKGTTYYYRAFVETIMGRAEGAIQSFTTVDDAQVSTLSATSVGASSANLRGQITSTGGGTISSTNFQYSTNSSLSGASTVGGSSNSGTFNGGISGLSAGTTYYYRARATNEAGTASGTIQNFTTIGLASVTTGNSSSVGPTTATLSGSVTGTGGGTISATGFQYSTNSSFSSPSTKTGSSTSGTFTANLTGLSGNTTYWFRAYVTNEAGTQYGTSKSYTTQSLGPCAGVFTKSYDGHNYPLVEAGGECWFAEDLQATSGLVTVSTSNPGTSPGYTIDPAGGYIYNTQAFSLGACPSGWRGATVSDWEAVRSDNIITPGTYASSLALTPCNTSGAQSVKLAVGAGYTTYQVAAYLPGWIQSYTGFESCASGSGSGATTVLARIRCVKN